MDLTSTFTLGSVFSKRSCEKIKKLEFFFEGSCSSVPHTNHELSEGQNTGLDRDGIISVVMVEF